MRRAILRQWLRICCGRARHVARPILVSTDGSSIDRCNAALQRQLATLPTAAVARESVKGGFAVACSSVAEAVDSNRVAPEHLGNVRGCS